jgi:GH24 family phage-related lysozyme (muramidase)
MKTSENGKNMIKRYEGLRLTSYKAHKSEIFYTIGYGHYGADVGRGAVITVQKANELFDKDIVKYENAVNKLNMQLTQNQFDALVSFTYNCGTANLKRLVKGRTKGQIADALLLYNKAGGETLSGLTKRRKEERALFMKEENLDKIAREVIDGKWGNGRQRKEKLIAAGYNYVEVQKRVNNILTGNK